MLVRAMRRGIGLLALGAILGTVIRSDESSVEAGDGGRLEAVRLVDAASRRPTSLRALRGPAATVVAFLGIDCPIGNLYMPRLVELARRYRAAGVRFIGVNANAHETPEQVAEHARQFEAPFPVLKDEDGSLADLIGAERTCEAVVLDAAMRVRYRGAIDDQYNLDAHKDRPVRPYLASALDDLVAGREVAVAKTAVVGCPIERPDPRRRASKTPRFRPTAPEILARLRAEATAEAAPSAVTWAADVAPIVREKCQGCHRPGQVGQFSLLTYEQARRWSASIREVVSEGRMPPWHADPRYGRFANDRSLTPKERATLLAWVEQGAPAGDLSRAPGPREATEGWTFGRPDLVISMREPYAVAAEGTLPIQHVRVPTGFTEDRWVQAAEARPGDPEVVHHIVVFIDDHRGRRGDPERHTQTHLVSFAPGDLPSIYEPGTAKLIPAGSDLVFELHYTPVGRARLDRSSLGLIFASQPVTRRAYTKGISRKDFVIPAGAANHEVRSTHTFGEPVQILGFMPHMHLRGKDFLYSVATPGGRTRTLLSVPSYDFAWQSIYRLADPLAVPVGTRVDCVAHFDNSADNPANPDASRSVTWGEQTWDEMMIGFLDYSVALPRPVAIRGRATRRTPAVRR